MLSSSWNLLIILFPRSLFIEKASPRGKTEEVSEVSNSLSQLLPLAALG